MTDKQLEALAEEKLQKVFRGTTNYWTKEEVIAFGKEMYHSGAKEEKSVDIERLWNSESKTLDYCDLIIDGKRTESKHLDYMDKETFFKVINNLFKSPNKTT